jgi:RNA polymerase sigma-70 factor (ECF subfamily)
VDLDEAGIGRVERLDQISMAFLVLLQRLTPSERAVLLLHDVFEMGHAEIGALLGKNDAACRQLLKRARDNVAAERRVFDASKDEHHRLLGAFMGAVTRGDRAALLDTLAEDAVLVLDPGPGDTRFGRLRNVRKPVTGAQDIVTLIGAFLSQEPATRLSYVERTLNGQPAIVTFLDGRAISALLIAVAGGKVRHLFFQNDPQRLRHISPVS